MSFKVVQPRCETMPWHKLRSLANVLNSVTIINNFGQHYMHCLCLPMYIQCNLLLQLERQSWLASNIRVAPAWPTIIMVICHLNYTIYTTCHYSSLCYLCDHPSFLQFHVHPVIYYGHWFFICIVSSDIFHVTYNLSWNIIIIAST